jgi:hypothetical protein
LLATGLGFYVTAHALLRDRYAFWNFWLTIGALVPTAILLCLVFVTDDFASRVFHLSGDGLKVVNAATAVFAFVCVLIQLVWKPDSLQTAHAHANHFYQELILRSSPREPGELGYEVAVSRHLPPLRESSYIRLKRFHVRKEYLSRKLDESPWTEVPPELNTS